jgi:sialate O-acetylesterase
LYNGTIHPLRRLRFAGALWYQGEANTRSKDDYRPRLNTMIRSWRELFGQPALPVVLVQLPDFGLPKDDGWMRVQEAQRLVARDLDLPLVVTIGQGSRVTIHPANKAEIGRRAGLAALQHVYRQPVVGSSPAVQALRFDGGAAILGFSADLVVAGAAVSGFELAGSDQVFVPATAQVAGRQVTVTADGLGQPVAIRYLWVHAPAAVTLTGPTGLPVGPFRFGAGAPQPAP